MYRKSPAPLAFLMVVLALGLLAAPGLAAEAGVVAVQLDNARVEWVPQQGQETYLLSVAGPEGFRWTEEFSGNASMSIFDANGQVLPDGFYNYELRAVVQVPEALRQKMQEVQRTGDADLRAELEAQLPAPTEPVVGSFRILDGALVRGDLVEPPAAGPRRVTGTPDALRSSETPEAIELDQVIPDDLIVQGSICVGFDCVNNENFGFDTIRLKENNTRIKFEDTSAGTFPSTDWQLTANDSASGGQNKFSIEDITGARVPFTIEGSSTTNSIYIDSTGRVGFRTSTPVLDLHVATSNTPGMRLEQNGSGGFTPQTWDIAGNEANFFVRDVTSGSRLPFRIRPGAPTSSIDIAASGDVGIGTASPSSTVHVRGTDGNTQIFVEEASGTVDDSRILLQLTNNGSVRYDMTNSATGVNWSTRNLAAGYTINRTGDADTEFQLADDGTLTISGMLVQNSSRSLKQDFRPANPLEILSKIVDMPLSSWSYTHQDRSVRHLGPMAEDFWAAFGLGQDDKHIAPSDKAGVALAAIQGLHQVVEAKDQEIADLKSRIEALEKLVQELATNK